METNSLIINMSIYEVRNRLIIKTIRHAKNIVQFDFFTSNILLKTKTANDIPTDKYINVAISQSSINIDSTLCMKRP